jgi:hypothetical protein
MVKVRKVARKKAAKSSARKVRRGKAARSKTRTARTKNKGRTMKRKSARTAKKKGVGGLMSEMRDLRQRLAGHNTFED